jgi:hypothetical protein
MSPGTHLLALASDSVGQPLIIRLIIQTILLYPSGAVWTDRPSNVSRLDPSGAVQIDAEHPTRNRKVVGSNPTSGSKSARSATWRACFACFTGNHLATSCPQDAVARGVP